MLRREIPLTQQELANRAGISVGWLSGIECRKVLPSPYTAKRIAKALNRPYLEVWRAIQADYRGKEKG